MLHIFFLKQVVCISHAKKHYRLRQKFEFILRATFQHAKNLAMLTVIYKTSMLIMQRITGQTHPLLNFMAAFMGGYAVFGENNKVNMQVCCVAKLY